MQPTTQRPVERLALRPGVRVLRRGPDQVQVGLDPRHALVLPLSAGVRRTLRVIAHHGPTAEADPDVVRRLREHGSLAAPRPRLSARLDLRRFGVAPWEGVADLLAGTGLQLVDPLREAADVGLLVGVGEPDRDLLDPWVAEGLPHLVLRLSEGTAVVGPFVVPGRTACLRCVDGHHADSDPRWPLLVEQQAVASEHLDGAADAAPATLLALAASWAVSDLVTHLGGDRPATWSATLRLPESLAGAELVTWLRHAECGCAWNGAARLSG